MTEEQHSPLTLAETSRLIHVGEITPTEVVSDCLEKITKHNTHLKAFLHVMAEQALKEAGYATDALERGEDWGVLHGIPLGIKDLIDVEGVHTTAGSDFRPGCPHPGCENSEGPPGSRAQTRRGKTPQFRVLISRSRGHLARPHLALRCRRTILLSQPSLGAGTGVFIEGNVRPSIHGFSASRGDRS